MIHDQSKTVAHRSTLASASVAALNSVHKEEAHRAVVVTVGGAHMEEVGMAVAVKEVAVKEVAVMAAAVRGVVVALVQDILAPPQKTQCIPPLISALADPQCSSLSHQMHPLPLPPTASNWAPRR